NWDGTPRYQIHTDEVIWSSPVLVDLYGNGYLEIVVGTGLNYDLHNVPGARAAGDRLLAYDYQGHMLPGWPYLTTTDFSQARQTYASPAVADLNGDGLPEIIEEDRGGYLHVIQANGQPLPGWAGGKKIDPPGVPPGDQWSSPIVADVNGDGRPDLIASSGWFLTAFDASGAILAQFQTANNDVHFNAAAVGQFDGNPGLELASVTNLSATSDRPNLVTMYSLPPSPLAPPWPMLRRSADGHAVAYSAPFANYYVTIATRTLLGRDPSPAELAADVFGLLSNATDPNTLARALAFSPEGQAHIQIPDTSDAGLTRVLGPLYATAFGTALGPDSLAAIAYDLHHNVSPAAVLAAVVSSGGNYVATSHLAAYIRSLYRDALGREAMPDEVASALRGFDNGSQTLPSLANMVVNSPEGRERFVRDMFLKYLGRDPGPGSSLANYGSREDLIRTILTSDEYYQKNGGNNADYIRAVFRDLLHVAASQQDIDKWSPIIGGGSVSTRSVDHPDVAVTISRGNHPTVHALAKKKPRPPKKVCTIVKRGRRRIKVCKPVPNPDPTPQPGPG
ncbi:MAG: VCBS repeat-containing protein, partial [Isosphaeraceae bacterium]|nr:VCBS repeat-containing protein [Isosphaeraceae bacterium]